MSSKTYTTIGTLALVLVLAGSIFAIPSVVHADQGGQPNCPPQSNAPQCQGNGDGSGTSDEGTSDGSGTGDESTGDESTGDESTGDESTGDESTGDESTGDGGDTASTEDTGDDGNGSEESDNDESESAPAAAKSGGRSWALVVKFVVGFNEQGLTQETIPESTTDITLYEAQNSDLGYNYFDTLRALGLLGINPMDLTDAQMVWLLEHFHEIAGIVTE